jgi:hypothetical protein
LTRNTIATGPKNSSRKAGLPDELFDPSIWRSEKDRQRQRPGDGAQERQCDKHAEEDAGNACDCPSQASETATAG